MRNKIQKIEEESSFFTCSNLAPPIKAAQQNNAVPKISHISLFLFFFFYRVNKGVTDKYVKPLARFVIDQGLATLVMTEKKDVIHWGN